MIQVKAVLNWVTYSAKMEKDDLVTTCGNTRNRWRHIIIVTTIMLLTPVVTVVTVSTFGTMGNHFTFVTTRYLHVPDCSDYMY